MSTGALGILAAVVAAAVPSAASAERVVDYTIDEATAAQNATEQGVPLAPLPAHGTARIAVQIGPAVDHEVVRGGIACSVWKVQNPLSILLRKFLTAWDRDGTPSSSLVEGTDLLVAIDRASTLSRCVATGELKSKCITRVSIDGSSTAKGGVAQPFHVEREETTKAIGACAGLTRGIGLVSRDAVSLLIARLAGSPPAAS